MIERILLGIPTVHAASSMKSDEKKCANCPGVCRPSELPYYPQENCECRTPVIPESSYVHDAIVSHVSSARVNIQAALSKLWDVNSQVKESYDNTINKTKWIVQYLREEDHEQHRIGAVAIGTLSGFILGLRGGIFKRLWYASIGTGIMGAICYPEQSEKLAKNALVNGKQYSKVAYNFLYGVKPGDPQPEFNFPELKLPHSLSEFYDMSVDMGKSVKNAVLPPPSSATENKPSEGRDNQ